MPYKISPEGCADARTYQLSKEAADKILKIKQVANLPPDKCQKLLKDIQKALQWTYAYQQMPLPSRAELSKAITNSAKLSTQLFNALNTLPDQAMTFFNNAGTTIARQKRLAESIMIDCDRADQIAKMELAGAGETPKGDIQRTLCHDIAKALESAGLKVTVSRPKTENNSGGVFWQISKICFEETNITVADMKRYMSDGRKMLKNGRKINH